MSESIRFDGSLRFASPEVARKHFEAIPEHDEELAFGRKEFRQRGEWLDVRSSGFLPLSSWEPSVALIRKLARDAVEGSVDAAFALENHPIRLLAGGRKETLSHSERLEPRFNADWYARHPAEARAAEEATFRPRQVPTQLEPHALPALLEDCLVSRRGWNSSCASRVKLSCPASVPSRSRSTRGTRAAIPSPVRRFP